MSTQLQINGHCNIVQCSSVSLVKPTLWADIEQKQRKKLSIYFAYNIIVSCSFVFLMLFFVNSLLRKIFSHMMSKNMDITPGTIQTNYHWQTNIRPFVQVRDNVFANGNGLLLDSCGKLFVTNAGLLTNQCYVGAGLYIKLCSLSTNIYSFYIKYSYIHLNLHQCKTNPYTSYVFLNIFHFISWDTWKVIHFCK